MRLVALLLFFVSPALAAVAGDPPPLRIEVQKEARVLRLLRGDELVAEHPIGLGFSPFADKVRQGDGATPEGDYFVCVKNPKSRFLLSLGINYPNAADAARGLRDGLISQAEHDRIVRAATRGTCPPWKTSLGGEIFIHGRGSTSDWTLGCVALDDDPMRQLFAAVPIGTRVHIER